MFKYENDEIKKKMGVVNAKYCLPSFEMERYIPKIQDLFFESNKIRQRCVFYSTDYTYEDHDLQ